MPGEEDGGHYTLVPEPQVILAGAETILLVEDERGVGDLVEQQLTQLGYRVLRAGNGQEALEQYGQSLDAIDLVLSDVAMPQMSGPELIKILRERGYGGQALYISGYGEPTLAQADPLAAGAPMLAKPYSRSRLASTIRHLLDDA